MLSIVDRGQFDQPASVTVGGNEVLLNFNGEVYNHDDLRSKLIKQGAAIRSRCDTEVVLWAYLTWGTKAFAEFDGDFAIAIWDGRSRSLILSRDKFGVKPLFYFIGASNLVAFASEPKAFRALPQYKPEINAKGLGEFLYQKEVLPNAGASSSDGFLLGISCVEPGSYIRIADDAFEMHRYFEESDLWESGQVANGPRDLREAIERSIVERIPEEVPYGTLLSGGIDSTIVASIVRQGRDAFPAATVSFTRGNDPDYPYARLAADSLGIELIAPKVNPASLAGDVDRLVHIMDEPHETSRQLVLLHAYRALSERGVVVALTGEGADEFNAGYYLQYPGFGQDTQALRSKDELIEAIRVRFEFASSVLNPDLFNSELRSSLESKIVDGLFRNSNWTTCADVFKHHYIRRFLPYRLDANDRLGMHYGIETRVPFCDVEAATVSLSVPDEINISGGLEKVVLRKAFSDILPAEIAKRAKSPLPENDSIVLHKAILNVIRDRIPDHSSTLWSVLNKTVIEQSLTEYERNVQDYGMGRNGRAVLPWLNQATYLSEKPGYRAKHYFFLLSLISWIDSWDL